MVSVSRQRLSPQPNVTICSGIDYCDVPRMTQHFAGAAAVIHLAARAHVLDGAAALAGDAVWRAANVEAALAVASAARAAGCTRFVLVSSIGVNGNHTCGRAPFTETDPADPQEPYARSKCDAERHVRELLSGSTTELTVLRPTLVYGPGCSGNFARLVKLVHRMPLVPLGAIRSRRSLLGVENFCEAILLAATHPACAGRTFLLSDGEDVRLNELVRLIAAGLAPQAGRLVFVPRWMLQGSAALLGNSAAFKKLTCELLVDSRAFREATGWRASIALSDGVFRAACSFITSPENAGSSP